MSPKFTQKFVYGPGIDEPVCMIDVDGGDTVYYYHFDGLGSVAALSDVNNVIVKRYSYDVFGAPTIYDVNSSEISQSTVGNPYMFTARRADDETALYYYRARYYAFNIGRFLQTDPIGYIGGLNLYTYCDNNPVAYVDPLGTLALSPYAEGGVIYEPSEFFRIRPPNAFRQQQIDNVIEGMINTGDPVLVKIANDLQDREIVIDSYLVKPQGSGEQEWTAAYVMRYRHPNTIYLSPYSFSKAPPVVSGQHIDTVLMELLIHEHLHLVSRFDVTGVSLWIDGFFANILGYNDGLDEPYGDTMWTVAERTTGKLSQRYWDALEKQKSKSSN